MLLDERWRDRMLLCGVIERSAEKQGADQGGGEKNREVEARNVLHDHIRAGGWLDHPSDGAPFRTKLTAGP